MKKIGSFVLLVLAMVALTMVPAFAGTVYTVAVDTYAITDSAYIGAQISGSVDISNLVFSNSGATAQTISVYELATTTTTANLIATFVLPAVAGFYRPLGDQNFNDRVTVQDVAFRKSATGTTVNAVVIYH